MWLLLFFFSFICTIFIFISLIPIYPLSFIKVYHKIRKKTSNWYMLVLKLVHVLFYLLTLVCVRFVFKELLQALQSVHNLQTSGLFLLYLLMYCFIPHFLIYFYYLKSQLTFILLVWLTSFSLILVMFIKYIIKCFITNNIIISVYITLNTKKIETFDY